jgi:hypothetical protein
MRTVNLSHLGVLMVVGLVLGIMGCGGSTKSDVANLNGAWQDPSNHLKIVLNLSGDAKTIDIDGKTLPVTIKKNDSDRISLNVSDPAAGSKEWNIYRVWDDNGSHFTLKFEHDGRTENLNRITG